MQPHPTLSAETRDTALQVVTSPASFADDPASRLAAWAALKSGRGQPMTRLHIARIERYQRHYAAPVAALPVRLIRAYIPDAPFFDGMAS